MATNINLELFKRYAPKKKLEIINSLSSSELLATSIDTIKRIVKEAGSNMYKSRNKRLSISSERRAGNDWNSIVEGIELRKGVLFLDCYFQMSHTDTNVYAHYTDFIRRGEYRGTYTTTNRYGDLEPHYFTYRDEDKANVIRSILLEYVNSKYNIK